MLDQIFIDILAYGHVLSAMGWLGGGILLSFVLGPNLMSLSPGSRLEFNAKVLPKAVRFVEGVVLSTLLFGVLLFYAVSPLTDTQNLEIYTGMGLALVVGAVAFSLIVPSFGKVSKLSAEAIQSGQPPSPDMMKYGRRARLGSVVGVVLLFVVLATMIASGFS